MSASALAKAEDMAINNYFAHYSPNGKKPWDWINRDNYAYLFVGENLAINFTSAEAVHEALMNSPTHRQNILNEKSMEGLSPQSWTSFGPLQSRGKLPSFLPECSER